MLKREKSLLILTGLVLLLISISFISDNYELEYTNYHGNANNDIELSASLEGAENIIITKVERDADISAYGLLTIEDNLKVKNLNNYPISSIFFGFPEYISENLVYLEATGFDQNTFLAERSYMILNGYEMIAIYFDSPLLPYQTKIVNIKHIFKDVINYIIYEDQAMMFKPIVYPIVPYKMEGEIIATFKFSETAESVEGGWGFVNPTLFNIKYDFESIKDEFEENYITPFLENIGDRKTANIYIVEKTYTKTEMTKINREIRVSPWGIIEVKEDFSLKNLGLIDFYSFSIKIPEPAINLHIFDYLGEIKGVTVETSEDPGYKLVTVELLANRVKMTPNSTFRFNVEYNLPFENYISLNWFEQSIQIDLFTTVFDYLGNDQTINVIIEGCHKINSITEFPYEIERSQGATMIVYKTDHVSPGERKVIQFTFTIDLFEILTRPIIFMLLIALIASIFVLIIKTRKREYDTTMIAREFVPINEIREFCSLYEEKNALTLEIRQSEEDTRRKKMAKKKYKNILTKNTAKIDEIQKEIIPFKEMLIETSDIFENIVKKLDVLEAERISVRDSLTLLESRYKRGRLPSRAAYLKLSDDFKKRRKKIDRTIDKLIQQLRSYLL
ncbi:MAG: hypothetical protein ACFFB6_05885 [Promethearchaeota archaeon]